MASLLRLLMAPVLRNESSSPQLSSWVWTLLRTAYFCFHLPPYVAADLGLALSFLLSYSAWLQAGRMDRPLCTDTTNAALHILGSV